MPISDGNGLTPEAGFFLTPERPLHRQYEALRAYFVDALPSQEQPVYFSQKRRPVRPKGATRFTQKRHRVDEGRRVVRVAGRRFLSASVA